MESQSGLLEDYLERKKKMAKYRNIGSICKAKDGKGNYLKITEDVVLKKGQILSLVDPRTLGDELLAKGLINEEVAEKMRESGLKTPSFVRFNVQVKNEA